MFWDLKSNDFLELLDTIFSFRWTLIYTLSFISTLYEMKYDSRYKTKEYVKTSKSTKVIEVKREKKEICVYLL